MKSKYLIPLSLAFAAMTFQSCGDFLETEPAAIYSEDLVWSSPANIEAFIYGKYSTVNQWYRDAPTADRTFSTNMVNCRAACPGEARGLMENSYDYGLNGRFSLIRACNMIIEKCGNSSVLDPVSQKQYVAIGKLMRAMTYYDLARKGGKFIWVDKVLQSTDPDFNLPLTKSVAESYKLVLTDLREAVPNLPESAPAGGLTRDFGYAFMSEVLLTAAAYTDDDASLRVNGKSLYEEAVAAVDAIKNAELDPNFEDIFNENGAYSSPEIILAQYWSKDNTQVQNTYMINLIANVTNAKISDVNCGPLFKQPEIFECWLDYTPSQNLVDAFLVIDEADGQAKRWWETSQFKNNTKEIDQATAFGMIDHKTEDIMDRAWQVTTEDVSISDLMYNNRDARFDATILHDNSEFYGETLTMYNYGNYCRWSGTNYGANHFPLTNYALRKTIYTNCSPRPFYNTQTNWHMVISRYGRALLNKAEALLRLNRVSEAVATYNRTRTVHGQLPASTTSDLATAWEEYKIERQVELVWESDYYWSLLRWGKYGKEANHGEAPSGTIQELTVPATYIEINQSRTAAYVGQVLFQNNMRAFNPNRGYLWPITQSLINANSAITNADQNPGWD